MDASPLQEGSDGLRASRLRVCKRCKFSSADAKEFGHHQMHAHQEAAQINACEECEFRTASYTELQRHRRLHRQSTDSQGNRKQSVDAETTDIIEAAVVDDGNNNFISNDKRLLAGLSLSDVNSDSATDDEAGVSFRSLPTRTYVCKDCGVTTNSAKRYLYHLRDDHGQKKFVIHECDSCDYASRYKQKLTRHRRSHYSSPVPSPKSGLARSSTPVQLSLTKKEDLGSVDTSSGRSSKSSTPVQELLSQDDVGDKLVIDCGNTENGGTAVLKSDYKDSDSVNKTPKENGNSVILSHLAATGKDSMADDHKMVSDQIAKMASMAQHVAEGTYRPQFKPDLSYTSPLTTVNQGKPAPSSFSGALKTYRSPTQDRAGNSDAEHVGDSPHKSGNSHTSPPSGSKPKNYAPFREAVDPAKYVTIQEPDGVKYACSKCGNVYKWRKSLNKHWKEKHEGELPEPRGSYTPLSIPRVKPIDVSPSQISRDFSASKAVSPAGLTSVMAGSAFYNTDSVDVYRKQHAMKASSKYVSPEVSPKAGINLERPRMAVNAMSKYPAAPLMYNKRMSHGDKLTHQSMPFIAQGQRSRSTTLPLPRAPSLSPKTPVQSSRELLSRFAQSRMTPPAAHSSDQKRYKLASIETDPVDLTQASPRLEDSGSSDGVLDLSMKGVAEREAKALSLPPPPQHQPIDFSRKVNDGFLHPGVFTPQLRVSPMEASPSSLGLQCPSCAYTARNKFDYDKHMEVHLRKNLHKCAECQQSYPSIGELNEHFQLYHLDLIQAHYSLVSARKSAGSMKGIAVDPSILQNFPQSSQLYKHLVSDPSKQPLPCVVCGALFQWQWNLAKHFEQDHASLPNPYKKRDHSSTSSPSLSAEDAIKKPKLFEPNVSPFSSPREQLSPDEATYQCSQCSFVAASSSELTRHQLKHSIGWQFRCHLCHFSIQNIEGIHSHYSICHPDASYNMDDLWEQVRPESVEDQYLPSERAEMAALAGEDTTIVIPEAPEETEANQQNQGSSAEMLLPYKCSVCEYRARWPSEINQHMKNHSDEKPFHCPRCSYKSKWKWDVVKHLKRCGGGSVKDVVDTTRIRKQEEVKAMLSNVLSPGLSSLTQQSSCADSMLTPSHREVLSSGPPNVTVMPQQGEKDDSSYTSMMALDYSSDRAKEVWNSPNSVKMEPTEGGLIEENMESIVTDVQNFCNQCLFVGHSPAELKRHSRVHSDEKPFVCQTCGYCSKWKCDLKKHLRTYNHVSAVPLTYGGHGRRPADWQQNVLAELNAEKAGNVSLVSEEENVLYGCNQCRFITPKKFLLDSHMKNHHDPIIPTDGHLRCKQCSFEAPDLSSLIQHKIAHSNQESPSTSFSETGSSFAPSPSKHRRKPQFVMKASSSAQQEADSEPDSNAGATDLSKPSDIFGNVPTPDIEPEKSALLAALGLEVTAKVRQLQRQQRKKAPPVGTVLPIIQDMNWLPNKPYMSKQANYKCSQCPYSTDNRTTFEKHVRMHNTPNRYRCEWCNWSTDRLNLLYRHAQSVHPDDLAMEEKETFYDKVRGRSHSEGSSREGTPSKIFAYNNPTSPLTSLAHVAENLGKHAEKETRDARVKKEMSGNFKVTSTVPEGTKPKRKLKNCHKCAYVTDNVTTLNRHLSKHGFNGKFKCTHCDYCVNKAHIIKYHLRTVHSVDSVQPPAVKMTVEDKTNGRHDEDSNDSAMFEEEPTNGDAQRESSDDTDEYFSEGGSDEVSVEVTKIKGQEMKIIQERGKTLYGCTKCTFSTGNVTNAISHSRQHGAKKKYKCEQCDYSLDMMRHMVHHMKNFHPETADQSEDSSDGGSATDGLQTESNTRVAATTNSSLTEDYLAQITPEKFVFEQSPQKKLLVFPIGSKPLGSLFRCRKCVFVTPSMATFLKHKNFHKIRESKFACGNCGYTASTGRLLQQHIKSHCSVKGGEVTGRKVMKVSPIKHNYVQNNLHNKHKFECQLCPFMTYIAAKYQSHLSCHRTQSKYTCEHCSYSVHRADHLQRHKVVHLLSPSKRRSPASPAKKPLKCSLCPYSTHSHTLLVTHGKSHQSPRKALSCHSCNYATDNLELLHKHVSVHSQNNNNNESNGVVLPLVNGLSTNC